MPRAYEDLGLLFFFLHQKFVLYLCERRLNCSAPCCFVLIFGCCTPFIAGSHCRASGGQSDEDFVHSIQEVVGAMCQALATQHENIVKTQVRTPCSCAMFLQWDTATEIAVGETVRKRSFCLISVFAGGEPSQGGGVVDEGDSSSNHRSTSLPGHERAAKRSRQQPTQCQT